MKVRILLTCLILAFSAQGIAGKKKKKNKAGRGKSKAAVVIPPADGPQQVAPDTEGLHEAGLEVAPEVSAAGEAAEGEAPEERPHDPDLLLAQLKADAEVFADKFMASERSNTWYALHFTDTGKKYVVTAIKNDCDKEAFQRSLDKLILNFIETDGAGNFISPKGPLTTRQKLTYFIFRARTNFRTGIFTAEEIRMDKEVSKKLLFQRPLSQAELEWLHELEFGLMKIAHYISEDDSGEKEATEELFEQVATVAVNLRSYYRRSVLLKYESLHIDGLLAAQRAARLAKQEAEQKVRVLEAKQKRIDRRLALTQVTLERNAEERERLKAEKEQLLRAHPEMAELEEHAACADDAASACVGPQLFPCAEFPFANDACFLPLDVVQAFQDPSGADGASRTSSRSSVRSTPDMFTPLRRNREVLLDSRVLRWREFEDVPAALPVFTRNHRFPEYQVDQETDAVRLAAFHRGLFLPNLLVAELNGYHFGHLGHTVRYLDPDTREENSGKVTHLFKGRIRLGAGETERVFTGDFEVTFRRVRRTGQYWFHHVWFIADGSDPEAPRSPTVLDFDAEEFETGSCDEEKFQLVGRCQYGFEIEDETYNLVIHDHSFPGGLTFYVHPHIIEEIREQRRTPLVEQLVHDAGGDAADAEAIVVDPAQIPVPELNIPDPNLPGGPGRDAAAAFGFGPFGGGK